MLARARPATARPSNDLFAVGMVLDALIDWPGPQLATIIARATGQHHQPFRDAEGPAQASARLRMIDRPPRQSASRRFSMGEAISI
ncbi:MAG: hypothetical protein U0Z44_01460 [Kouleothrix sp.]